MHDGLGDPAPGVGRDLAANRRQFLLRGVRPEDDPIAAGSLDRFDDEFVGEQLDDRVLLNSKELDVAGITDGIKTKIVTLIAQRNESEKALAMERACHRRTLLEGDNAREALELSLGTQGNMYQQLQEENWQRM